MRTSLSLALLTVSLSAFAFASAEGATLEMFYSFDNDTTASGGIADLSGNNRDGSGQDVDGGGIDFSFSSVVPAQLGSGMSLDLSGTTDYVRSDSPGYDGVTGTANRTLAAWIKTPDTSPTRQHLLEWGTAGAGSRWSFRVNDDGQLRVEVQGGFIVGTTIIDDDAWHHVAATFADDGSPDVSEVLLYVDGSLEGISSFGTEPISTGIGTNVGVGNSPVIDANGRPVAGLLDDVAIWSEALSASQISLLADGTRNPLTLFIPEPSTIALYSFSLLSLAFVGWRRRRR